MRKILIILSIVVLFFSCSGSSSDDGGGSKAVTLNISDIPLGANGYTIWMTVYEVLDPTLSMQVLEYETTVAGTDMSFTVSDGTTGGASYDFDSDTSYLIDVQIDLNGDDVLNVFDGDFASNDNEVAPAETSLDIGVTGVGGTITLSFTGSSDADGHSIYYTVYDTNAVDGNGTPTGTMLGQGFAAISGGTGSGTVVTMDQSADAVFANRTFYIGGMIDMNDNIDLASPLPDSGDRYGDFTAVTVADDNLTESLTSAAFPLTIP